MPFFVTKDFLFFFSFECVFFLTLIYPPLVLIHFFDSYHYMLLTFFGASLSYFVLFKTISLGFILTPLWYWLVRIVHSESLPCWQAIKAKSM